MIMCNSEQRDDKNGWSLAVETSCAMGSVALASGSEVIAEQVFSARARHAAELLPTVDKLLADNGLQPQQIARTFVSAGPGSFTGLRVGFTFARAFAQVCSGNMIAVPTCEVIAENVQPLLAGSDDDVYVGVVLDAKRGQVYAAGFHWTAGRFETVLDQRVICPRELVGQLGRPLWVCGEGIDYHRAALQGEDVVIVDQECWQPRAVNVLKVGLRLTRRDMSTDYNKLVPAYVRLPEAEERLRARE